VYEIIKTAFYESTEDWKPEAGELTRSLGVRRRERVVKKVMAAAKTGNHPFLSVLLDKFVKQNVFVMGIGNNATRWYKSMGDDLDKRFFKEPFQYGFFDNPQPNNPRVNWYYCLYIDPETQYLIGADFVGTTPEKDVVSTYRIRGDQVRILSDMTEPVPEPTKTFNDRVVKVKTPNEIEATEEVANVSGK